MFSSSYFEPFRENFDFAFLEATMDSMRGQGGIQMLLTAEQEAQQIVYAARNGKSFGN